MVKASSSSSFSTADRGRTRKRADYIEPDEVAALSSSSKKKQRVLSSATRVYILDDKLSDEEHDALRAMVVDLGGMNASMEFANVILTKMRAPQRVKRYLNDDVKERKVPILHTSWLYDSAREALLQAYDPYKIIGATDTGEFTKEDSAIVPSSSAPQGPQDDHQTDDSATASESEEDVQLAVQEHETVVVDPSTVPPWRNVEYACLRPSPLKSASNQDLVDELEVLRLQRILAGKQEMNATAYGRAISAIKAYPHPLQPNPANAKNLKGVGPKIAKMIVQYYEEGRIAEAEAIRKDYAFQTMSRFMELYGIGPKRAREYYSEGARTMDDVIKMGGSLSVHLHVDECLRILPDLNRRIPRKEVEAIAKLIFDEANAILPGCSYTVCGGHRRGKSTSGDVDVVISLPKPDEEEKASGKGNGLWNSEAQMTLLEDLLRALKRKTILTHVINVSQPHSIYETTYSRLDLAEVVVMPSVDVDAGIPVARYRRVDIILGPWQTFGAAVLGWTGSRQFERDIRLIARNKGYTFHSTGLVVEGQRKPVSTPDERDIFRILDIAYMPPPLRNCDA